MKTPLVDHFLRSPGNALSKIYAILTDDRPKFGDVPDDEIEEVKSLGYDALELLTKEYEAASVGLDLEEAYDNAEEDVQSEVYKQRKAERHLLFNLTARFPQAGDLVRKTISNAEMIEAYFETICDNPTDQQRLDALGWEAK